MCAYYEPRVVEQCTEERAEEVRDKERANFCDYFKPQPGAYIIRDTSKAQASKAKLDNLFGADSEARDNDDSDSARDALEELFREK